MGRNIELKINDRESLFVERTSEILGIREESVYELFKAKPSCLVINSLLPYPQNLVEELKKIAKIKKIDKIDDTYVILENKEVLTKHEWFHKGYYYIQNLSSLLPVIALAPKQSETILDMCAAPGGKTYNIARNTQNKSIIYANDSSKSRVYNLKNISKIYNISVEDYYIQPAQYLSKHLKIKFDSILIDAPCSGEGLLDLQDKQTLKYWSKKKINRLKKLQKMILEEAYKMIKPGGTIVYSTCTLSPEENEEVVEFIINKYDDVQLKSFSLPFDNLRQGLTSWENRKYSEEVKKIQHIIPNEYMQAFTISKLVKK